MAQINTGLRGALKYTVLYRALQRALGSARAQRILAEQHIAPHSADRVLDIGCGPAEILRYLPRCHYVGIDPNPNYIASAISRFGDRGNFVVGHTETPGLLGEQPFNIICALGVLHHLNDREASALFAFAAKFLAPGGKLVTTDVVFLKNQRWIARALAAGDRGRNVRTPDGYRTLAAPYFENIEDKIWPDVYRLPYDANIMTCHSPTVENR